MHNNNEKIEKILSSIDEITDSSSRYEKIQEVIGLGSKRKEVIPLFLQWAKDATDSAAVGTYIERAVEFGERAGSVKTLEDIRSRLVDPDTEAKQFYDSIINEIKTGFSMKDKIRYRFMK